MRKAAVPSSDASDKPTYSHPIPDREFIMGLLGDSAEPLNREQLARMMKLNLDEEKEGLRRRLRAMERDGQIAYQHRQGFTLIREDELISGRVIGHPDGFGFLATDEAGDDLFLSDNQMLTLFDGDRVQVRVSGVDRRGRREAALVKVLERNTAQLVGLLQEEDNAFFLQPENRRIAHEIDIDRDELNGAKPGQYVAVEITEYPSARYNAAGRVVELLGDAMAPGMEIDVAIRSHDIPHRWPDGVVRSAEEMGHEVAEADKQHRADLRHLPFVTIDGEDARDFDDAVYCESAKGGGWKLFVAIADVSHYVLPDSLLDQEAQKRGTSVYFPGRVVPMLPEALSNGLCSLNPKVDRLVMVCEMAISASGKMTDYKFSEGVIHSHARLTYNQVNAMLNAPKSTTGKKMAQRHQAIMADIETLHKLYGALSIARGKRGSIDFETKEVTFKFTECRKIDQIMPVVRNDAHKMIEEFMLCANVATARFLEKLKLPALFRVHDGPRDKKLSNLRAFLGERGLTLGGGEKPATADYDRLMSSIEGRDDADIIRTMMLRSLSQAEYSPDNQGHFGLAYSAYAHFTSPIRRYPDLLVHRAIRSVIRKRESGNPLRRVLKRLTGIGGDPVQRVKSAARLDPGTSYPYDLATMANFAQHCSQVSRRADKASWDVEAWLKCEFMQGYVGETFSGTVASVASFGLFIELDESQIEGLVHISTLKDDYYNFDAGKQRLIGERSNAGFGLGDRVKVRVVRVDMEQRKIEFEMLGSGGGHKKKRKSRSR
ncbi:ribonuclease R [Marinobacterium jannaschii]|uniref:ribonuclease R n=1 Tax=Marinobacterium jannaschii TaxID=64970 RepID=UPI00068429FC|nr:ribonuclease R [Marinobacterium jannaschii]